MTERRYLVDIFGEVVQAVNTKLIDQLQTYEPQIKQVSYQFGHPLEIIEVLSKKDTSGVFAYEKYPLVALFTDIKETKGVLGVASTCTFTVIVMYSTTPQRRAKSRLDEVFKPIIHPIVDALVEEISVNPYFNEFDPDIIKRTETDRYYWGKSAFAANTQLRFNDFLDATEIEFTLSINPFCILPEGTKNIKDVH